MKNKNLKKQFYFLASALIFMCAVSVSAQTTAFNYQGKLTDAGNPASGNYLLQFKLFDAAAGGTQIGATSPDIFVTASNGVFTTQLDFGATPFTGADRFLEIAVKKNAGEPYTVLSPRQQINSSPYSIRTLSAAQADVALDSNKLGGVDASDYVTTASVGNSFIKNSTTLQTGANFNIGGNGRIGGSLSVSGAGSSTGLFSTGTGTGVFGNSTASDGTGVLGSGNLHGVFGNSGTGNGVSGNSASGSGVFGKGESQGSIALRASGSSWFQGDTSPLPASAGKGIVVGFGGEQGYIQSFDYGAFAPKNLLINNSGGNVGIGVALPTARLHIEGSGGGIFGTGLRVVGGNAVGSAISAVNNSGGNALTATGNVSVTGNVFQDLNSHGLPKAMASVRIVRDCPFGGNCQTLSASIIKCYNSTTGSTTGGCGFTLSNVTIDTVQFNFGFQVQNRFISLTAGKGDTSASVFEFPNSNTVTVINGFRNTSEFYIYVF